MEWSNVILSLLQSLYRTPNRHDSAQDTFYASIAHKVMSDALKNQHTAQLDSKVSPFSIKSSYFNSL